MKKSYKTNSGIQFNFTLIIALIINYGCKKNDASPNSNLPKPIQQIVTKSMLDSLKKSGMAINEGNTPPVLEGIYMVSPMVLVKNYGTDNSYWEGYTVGDTKYKFYDFNKNDLSLMIDVLQNGKAGNGNGSFISGNGNKFSVFSEIKKQAEFITPANTSVQIISGEITANGIINLQISLTMKSKDGDENNTMLMPIGATRIYIDNDSLSEKVNNFSFTKPINFDFSISNQKTDYVN